MNKIRNEKLLEQFGLHLKETREKKGLTQEALAMEADIPISQIGRIERGEINTTLSTLDALARAMKMSLKDLMNF